MLACLYHPTDGMRVFEDWEVEERLASGVWFNSPKTAEEYRKKIEVEIQDEKDKEGKTLELRKERKNEGKK